MLQLSERHVRTKTRWSPVTLAQETEMNRNGPMVRNQDFRAIFLNTSGPISGFFDRLGMSRFILETAVSALLFDFISDFDTLVFLRLNKASALFACTFLLAALPGSVGCFESSRLNFTHFFWFSSLLSGILDYSYAAADRMLSHSDAQLGLSCLLIFSHLFTSGQYFLVLHFLLLDTACFLLLEINSKLRMCLCRTHGHH